jgi:succinyl-diaminopimelate desuccinylase
VLNHRFAPDRTPADAEASVRSLLAPVLEDGDVVTVVDCAAGAPPGLSNPLLSSLIERNGLEVRAKLGWTDVAWFAALGIPACNLGPGDAVLAHTAGEHVTRASLERTRSILGEVLAGGVGA